MDNVLENLTIRRIIVHEIHKRDAGSARAPVLSDELTVLDARGMAALHQRTVEAVGHDSHSIQMDISNNSSGSVCSFVLPLLEGEVSDADFVAASRQLTNRLVDCQTSMLIPGGVVIIFDGTTGIDQKRCVGIIKADKLTGFALSSNRTRLVLDYLNNLLLTPQQKLYKLAFFVSNAQTKDEPLSISDILVFVFDSNNNKAASDATAKYFYDLYLGCQFQRNADVITRDFYNYTKEYITNSSSLNGEQKLDAMSALYVYLKVETSDKISVSDFAKSFLEDAREKDAYCDFMKQKKLPSVSFVKDISMVSRKLRQRKIKFSNSVSLIAPVDNFENYITVLETDKSSTTLRISGTIESEN